MGKSKYYSFAFFSNVMKGMERLMILRWLVMKNSMKREHYVTTAGFLDHIREALIKKFTNGQNNKL